MLESCSSKTGQNWETFQTSSYMQNMFSHIHIVTYIYTHTHTHICIHTYIHTHTQNISKLELLQRYSIYSGSRNWCLSTSWGSVKGSLIYLEHHNTMALRGLRGTLNWVPILILMNSITFRRGSIIRCAVLAMFWWNCLPLLFKGLQPHVSRYRTGKTYIGCPRG